MYENETYETILDRMLARVSGSLDRRASSPIYDTHSATAIELQILYIELDTLIANSYGDTAARDFLILLAKDRGLAPDEATYAVLQGEFTPSGLNLTGERFNIGEINYVVLEKMDAGDIEGDYNSDADYYKLQCETAGTVGNQYMGAMTPIDYISGLETAELTAVLIPGEDEEDTEDFRTRYFNSFDAQAFGGNQADYIEKVKSIDGVGSVKVARIWNSDISPADMIPDKTVRSWYETFIETDGPDESVKKWLTSVYTNALAKKLTVGGTIHIVITDSDDYGEASATLVESVQNTLDPDETTGEGYGLAPIGHVVSVASAEPVAVNVTTTATFEENYNWTNLQTAIEAAVDEYLLELRKSWADSTYTVVRISQVETKILGVAGVIDVSGTSLNGSQENLTLGEYEIPVLGGVSA